MIKALLLMCCFLLKTNTFKTCRLVQNSDSARAKGTRSQKKHNYRQRIKLLRAIKDPLIKKFIDRLTVWWHRRNFHGNM